ncbi:MAG: cytochrome c biogenesis protein [Vampirovibrionia bacterium]
MRETALKLHSLRFYFLVLVILLSFSVVSADEPNLEKIKGLSKPFSELLILDQGRYKPLDSYAKTKLLQFSGKTSIKLNLSENKTRAGESPASKPVNKTEKITYVEWFTAAVFEPDLIYSAKLFLINNPEVLTAINVAVDSHRRYSYDELRESISTLNQLAAQAESKPEEKRSLVEKELIRVSNNFHEFTQIASSFSLFQRKPMLADLAKPELLIALGINEGDENAEISLFNIVGKASELEQIINSASALKPDAVKLGFVLYSWIESYREYLNIFRREEVTAILVNPLPKDTAVDQEGRLEFINPWTYFYEIQSHLGRVAKRTSSRLRRTNDRSVLGVHEDHEDDENAEIGVSLHAHPDELKVLANASKLDSLRYCQKLQQAYDTADLKVFKESVKTLNDLSFTYIKSLNKSQPKLSLELLYNRVNPLGSAQLFYLLSLLVLVFRSVTLYGRKSSSTSKSFLKTISKSYDAGKIAAIFFLIGFALHAAAITLRIFILERAPVSNLYETFVFVAFVTALLGLILKFITKEKEISTFLGSLSAFALLLIASKFVTDGDSMKVLIAVLDSNFWLSTHVIAEMIGYAGVSLAGLIGHVYLIKYLIRQRRLSLNETISADEPYHDFMTSVQSHQSLISEIDLKFLNKIILGMIGFGLCFTFLGTMLGGIWADQSWGRFWGWDPKENGALLIILWTAITLHARLAGYIKDFGVAIFAIIGTMVVMLSWFGVNLLGVGLHSYGFTEGLMINLLSYFFIEFVFIFVVIFLQRRFLNRIKS